MAKKKRARARNRISPDERARRVEGARSAHAEWELAWQRTEREIEARGDVILCREGCHSCCFSRRTCTMGEGLVIVDYMREHYPPERQESFRLRVESAASSIRKLRADGYCESDELFSQAGGIECPLLERGRCMAYPVRPLHCRAQYAMAPMTTRECRKCPLSDLCAETVENAFEQSIPEVLSSLWSVGEPAPSVHFTPSAWRSRLASREGPQDYTWQDDRHDFDVLGFLLSLPDEGAYPPDLILLEQTSTVCDLYGEAISGTSLPPFRSLYKLKPGGRFDWTTREFSWEREKRSEDPYTIWMSDTLQERLMTWEAAKRSRGRVLCGGLGLGIFPQLALSLPRVESVDIVDVDADVIALIEGAWSQSPWPRTSDVTVVHGKIEDYLRETKARYDTVYIDTWDAIYDEYLPHLNWLRRLSEPVLQDGGEILFWGFDMMVRLLLESAESLIQRRDIFLGAQQRQLQSMALQYPLFHKMALWLRAHPACAPKEMYAKAHRLAVAESNDLGILKFGDRGRPQPALP